MALGLLTLLVLFGGLSLLGLFVRADGHVHLHKTRAEGPALTSRTG